MRGWGIKGVKGPDWARVGRKLVYQESPDNGIGIIIIIIIFIIIFIFVLATFEETVQITSPMESTHTSSSFSVLMQDEHSEISSSSNTTGNLSRVASTRAIFQQAPSQTQPLQQKQQQQQKVQQQIKAHQHELQQRVQKAQQQAQKQVQQQTTRRNEHTIPAPPSFSNSNMTTPNLNTTNTSTTSNTLSTANNSAAPFPQAKPHTPPQTPRQQQPLPKPHTRNSSAQDLSDDTYRSHTSAQSDASHRSATHAHAQSQSQAYAQAFDVLQRNSARDAITQGDATQRRTLQQLRPAGTPALPRLKLERRDNETAMKSSTRTRDDEEEEDWEADESESTFVYSNASTPRAHNHRYEDTVASSDEEQQRETDEYGQINGEHSHNRSTRHATKRKPKKDTNQSQQQQQQQLQLLLQHQLQQQLQQQLDQLQKQQQKPHPSRLNKYHEDAYDDILQHRRLHGRHSSVNSSDEDYERYLRYYLLL